MRTTELEAKADAGLQLGRRNLFRRAGYLGMGAAGLALTGISANADENPTQSSDSTYLILLTLLTAEDLSTVFYYNGLIGGMIQDPLLAGTGGSARNVTTGSAANVAVLRASLYQEMEHAQLFRARLGWAGTLVHDPFQNFYFPPGTFDTLTGFLAVQSTLENIFIGMYMLMIQEFTYKAAAAVAGTLSGPDAQYSSQQYGLYAKVAASILGVQAEHRAFGQVLGGASDPVNNVTFEQQGSSVSIYTGENSVYSAFVPYFNPSYNSPAWPGYSLATAVYQAQNVYLAATGALPS